MTSASIVIKSGREKPIIQQHPWIFSGAIAEVKGNPTPGDIVTVTDHKGRFLARGYWNPKSQIQVRILTWQDEEINEEWWRRMLKRAIEGRDGLANDPYYIDAYRLVNAENDFLPGLIVDRYNDWLVIQALTLGIDQQKMILVRLLLEERNFAGVYERSDVDVRGKEGLKSVTGLLVGQEVPELIKIEELERHFVVDIKNGHKTGFYLDQRESRLALASLIGQTELYASVLNLFCYTGGFGVYAVGDRFFYKLPASSVTNVDASAPALNIAEKNFLLNGDSKMTQVEFIQADVFQLLRDYAAEKKLFDIVILDPPKFAHNAGQVDKAARGYKDINLNAFKCIKSGGYLMTFSCSGAVSADLFQKIVFGALADSGRQAQILKHLGPGDDHPVALTFPEGAYLKGLLLRVY